MPNEKYSFNFTVDEVKEIDKELTDKVKDNLERYCQNYGLIIRCA